MFLIIVAFISLISLIVIHELGHFLLAKKFGIKVEEFGIGYPPRIFGKKIGETIYSLNWIPFGAFVKIYGHEKRINDPRSFSTRPVWQRALVILGGVVSFWLVSAVLLTAVMFIGAPTVIEDSDDFKNAKVQIVAVSPDSPAELAGLKIGDVILEIRNHESKKISKTSEVQQFVSQNKGREINLIIKRGADIFEISAVPRLEAPNNEGFLGIYLARTALKRYPWYLAPLKGIEATMNLTLMILNGWKQTFLGILNGRGIPQGMEVRGIVGIFDLFVQAGGMGLSYFLQFIAIISIAIALFNILPIPALDGGWFILLMIEAIRKKPLNEKIEKNISTFFFLLLLILMIWVTIKDIIRIF